MIISVINVKLRLNLNPYPIGYINKFLFLSPTINSKKALVMKKLLTFMMIFCLGLFTAQQVFAQDGEAATEETTTEEGVAEEVAEEAEEMADEAEEMAEGA